MDGGSGSDDLAGGFGSDFCARGERTTSCEVGAFLSAWLGIGLEFS
jgi:hypothetical protein